MAAKMLSDEEICYLKELGCVDDVKGQSIVWNAGFKAHARMRLESGDAPSRIFREAGCGPEVIGAKRIERCCARWRQRKVGAVVPSRRAQIVCSFCPTSSRCAAKSAHEEQVAKLKEQIGYQTELKRRAREKRWHDVSRLKKASTAKEKRIIANQRREIERLRSEVKALKALGALARASRRAPHQTSKSERFEVIWTLRTADPTLDIKAACRALQASGEDTMTGWAQPASELPARCATSRRRST